MSSWSIQNKWPRAFQFSLEIRTQTLYNYNTNKRSYNFKGDQTMSYREDYIKFTYNLLPQMLFKYKNLISYFGSLNKDELISVLSNAWNKLKLENPEIRSAIPNFNISFKEMNVLQNAIVIEIPEATEVLEAIYIAIIYSNEDKIRYLTYEIGDVGTFYIIETLSDNTRINYGKIEQRNKRLFIKELSDILVGDLF